MTPAQSQDMGTPPGYFPEGMVSLREFLGTKIDAVSAAMSALESSRLREHAADQEAIKVALNSISGQMSNLSERLGTYAEASRSFVTRDQHEALEAEVERRVLALRSEVDRDIGTHSGQIAELIRESSQVKGMALVARWVGFGGVIAALAALGIIGAQGVHI